MVFTRVTFWKGTLLLYFLILFKLQINVLNDWYSDLFCLNINYGIYISSPPHPPGQAKNRNVYIEHCLPATMEKLSTNTHTHTNIPPILPPWGPVGVRFFKDADAEEFGSLFSTNQSLFLFPNTSSRDVKIGVSRLMSFDITDKCAENVTKMEIIFKHLTSFSC